MPLFGKISTGCALAQPSLTAIHRQTRPIGSQFSNFFFTPASGAQTQSRRMCAFSHEPYAKPTTSSESTNAFPLHFMATPFDSAILIQALLSQRLSHCRESRDHDVIFFCALFCVPNSGRKVIEASVKTHQRTSHYPTRDSNVHRPGIFCFFVKFGSRRFSLTSGLPTTMWTPALDSSIESAAVEILAARIETLDTWPRSFPFECSPP
ncbi:hypothetical protein DdX_18788 [Ditylenchus destructor]|uniref:Uncharacterized protein n=1 Tax=Ditylenchus destructor TaxID=166010 RepID=A0AAD4MIZ8_9BILA|nr:hypothetical protein DdX_18788 [Ditylenchus destructor]